MRLCFLTLSSAWLFTVAALAGPQHVREKFAEEAELQPHQQLQMPAYLPAQKPLPEPPAPKIEVMTNSGIAITDGQSLLAYHGTLEPYEVAFKDNVWQYMSTEEATRRLAKLTKPAPMLPLQRRLSELLMLKADPPQGADKAWFMDRVEALVRISEREQALEMLESIPSSLSGELSAESVLLAYLQLRKPKEGCETILIDDLPTEGQLFCEAMAERFAKVELQLALAEEQGEAIATWLIKLLEYIQYDSGVLPVAAKADTQLGKAMIHATTPPEKTDAAEVRSYPKKPAYALLVLAERIRGDRLQDVDEWLALLERGSSDSAATFVAHELVRFLRTDPASVRSEAANSLPPFTATASASKQDKALLKRFYSLMGAFDYALPEVTMEWLNAGDDSSPVARPSKLSALSEEGNIAGYLIELPVWLEKASLAKRSDSSLAKRIQELRFLRETKLAQQLLAEAVLARLE